MAYKHGVYVSEVPTSILPPVEVNAGIPMIIGTAPVNMTDPTNVNKPKLCYSYEEAVKEFGFVPAEEDTTSGLKKFNYSICELIYSAFSLYRVAPIIVVNVLDPTTHKKNCTTTSVSFDAKTGIAKIAETGVLPNTLVLKAGEKTLTKDTDYIVSFDTDGTMILSSLKNQDGDFLCSSETPYTLTASKLDPSAVDADDIIGGVDTSGNKSGLELVDDVFPLFRVVPGTLIAPGFSSSPSMAAVMAAKCTAINTVFKAICAVDVPTTTVKNYTAVANWKNQNNITDPMQICCWPMIQLDGTVFNLSTQLACLMAQVDSQNDDVPYVSPSNKNLQMTGTCLADGSEVVLGPNTGAYLNSQGVVCALNFIGGWVAWGNRTAVYPGNTDVKDAFIPNRRMFNWIGNTFIQTFWSKVDFPATPRLINTIIDSANIWMNGLAAMQYILGGRIEFLSSENSITDLMDGNLAFHVYVTPPPPAKDIDFILEFDPEYLQTLFAA